MEVVRFIVVGLSVWAGISVLRNPLKVWPNTLAGVFYFAGAIGAVLLNAWWPLLAGWVGSLSLQGLCAGLMAKGSFNEQINAERARRGLPPLADGDRMRESNGI
jgi:hypothetical protein